MSPQLELTAVRCGAQNSVVIGATADITGLEAAGGSIENDPKPTKTRSKSRSAPSPVGEREQRRRDGESERLVCASVPSFNHLVQGHPQFDRDDPKATPMALA